MDDRDNLFPDRIPAKLKTQLQFNPDEDYLFIRVFLVIEVTLALKYAHGGNLRRYLQCGTDAHRVADHFIL